MTDGIGEWLQRHGLGRYVDTFAENEVDRQDAAIPRIIAHRMRSATLIALGRPTEALDHLKISYSLY